MCGTRVRVEMSSGRSRRGGVGGRRSTIPARYSRYLTYIFKKYYKKIIYFFLNIYI